MEIPNNINFSSNNNFQQDGGFFRCEMGKQWLNICFQIFNYSIEKIAERLGPKASIEKWMHQSRSVQDWNNFYISRWMQAVVLTKFKNATLFWRKGKDSPLLIEYIHVTFESTPGTITAKIPPLEDFLFCGFSVFFRRVVEICAAQSKNDPTTEKFTQKILDFVRTFGHDVASEAVRTAFSHVVNPAIRIDSRPSHESISMIMNLRSTPEEDDSPYESTVQIRQERRHREHKSRTHHDPREHREHKSHHSRSERSHGDNNEHKEHKSHHSRQSHKEHKEHKPHSQLSLGEKKRVDEFMKGANKRSSHASKVSQSDSKFE